MGSSMSISCRSCVNLFQINRERSFPWKRVPYRFVVTPRSVVVKNDIGALRVSALERTQAEPKLT